jgi:hypothetical protein
MKNTFLHGLLTGLLAGLASLIYSYAYSAALLVDFSKVVNAMSIFGASIFGGVAAALGYYFLSKWISSNLDVWFNIIFLVLTFVSFAGSFGASLPNDVETPELFVGLSIPMHIFPILFWLTTKPLFNRHKDFHSS